MAKGLLGAIEASCLGNLWSRDVGQYGITSWGTVWPNLLKQHWSSLENNYFLIVQASAQIRFSTSAEHVCFICYYTWKCRDPSTSTISELMVCGSLVWEPLVWHFKLNTLDFLVHQDSILNRVFGNKLWFIPAPQEQLPAEPRKYINYVWKAFYTTLVSNCVGFITTSKVRNQENLL